MKKIIFIATLFICLSCTVAFAESPAIPEKGLGRLGWVIQCSGNAPKQMYIAFALIAVLIIISAIYYRKISGGKK